MSDLEGFVTGLSKSLDNYLGMRNQYEILGQYQQQKTAAEMQKEMGVEKYKSDLKTQQEKTMAQYKSGLEDTLSPEMAEKALPGFGAQMVTHYNEQRKAQGLPELKVKEGTDFLKVALETLHPKDKAADENRELRFNNIALQYTEKMERHPLFQKIQMSGMDVDVVDNLIKTAKEGNTTAAAMLGPKVARGMANEVGVLTDKDVTRYVTSGMLTRKVADKLLLWMQGKQTDATLDEINQIGSVMKDVYHTKKAEVYNKYINRMSANLKISKQDAAERLDVPEEFWPNAKSKSSDSTKPSNSSATQPNIHTYPSGRKIIYNEKSGQWEPYNG